MREENTFEDPVIAKEWIDVIESQRDGSRDKELYYKLSSWLESISPKVVLEIGAGQGTVSSKINLSNRKYIGIEPSKVLIERAKELYSEGNKEFVLGNSYELPVETGSIDAVFSVGVWFHIEDLDKTHSEVCRVLRRGGEIMIFTSNPNLHKLWESWFVNPEKQGKKLIGKMNIADKALSKNIFYLHSESDIVDSLNKNNIQVLSIETFGFEKEGDKAAGDDGIWIAIRGIKK